jgi:hypothetical protein
LFVSFTSRIDYGFAAKGQTQLWMAAVNTANLANGDASYAPIWLPYQDVADKSLTPYWTETLACNKDPNGGCKGCVGGEDCMVDEQDNCECRANVK